MSTNIKKTNTQINKEEKEFDKELKKYYERNKDFFDSIKNITDSLYKQNKDYVALIKNAKQYHSKIFALRNFLFGASDEQIANSEIEFNETTEKISSSSLSEPEKKAAYRMAYNDKEVQDQKNYADGFIDKTFKTAGDEAAESLKNVLLGYQSFSEGMKSVGVELSEFMLQQLTQTLTQMLFSAQTAQLAAKGFKSLIGAGKGVFSSIGGALSHVFTRHSGGIIPNGANYEIPGTDEQLALLKGGERILSPGENAGYNSSAGYNSASPVVFNNFNIKAWDSKDVKKYLLENRNLLNTITFQGIKDNHSQLRTMVRNA